MKYSFFRSRVVLLALPTIVAAAAAFAGCVGGVSIEPPSSTPKGAGGGSIYALSNDGGPRLVRIDPVTGVSTTVSTTLPGASFFGAGAMSSALDLVHRRYVYIVPGDSPVDHMISVDIDSGALLADVALERKTFGLGVDRATGDLFCATYPIEGSDVSEIDIIDPLTGGYTLVSSYPPPSAAPGGTVLGDGDDFALGDYGVLVTDPEAGTIAIVPPSDVSLLNLRYDPLENHLIATSLAGDWYKGGSNEVDVRLVSVDPATGATHDIAALPALDHVLQADAAYDAATQRYFLVGGADTPQGVSMWVEGNDLVTIDAETGDVLASPEMKTPIFNLQFAP
ncbi:MAG: hypothetical protein U0414_18320 [Polyangiaceae bacterium]